MPGVDPISSLPPAPIEKPQSASNTRSGHYLFLIYSTVYAGFVLFNAFWPSQMEQTPLFGINLAVLYGLLLIGLAFGLALLFEAICRRPGKRESQI